MGKFNRWDFIRKKIKFISNWLKLNEFDVVSSYREVDDNNSFKVYQLVSFVSWLHIKFLEWEIVESNIDWNSVKEMSFEKITKEEFINWQ